MIEKVSELKHKLGNYFSTRRKIGKILYAGRYYNMKSWNDNGFIKLQVHLGLKSLILTILTEHSEEVLEETMTRFSKNSNPTPFIQSLSSRILTGKKPKTWRSSANFQPVIRIVNTPKVQKNYVGNKPNIEFLNKFDEHFGVSTHRLIRSLIMFYSSLSLKNRFNDGIVTTFLDDKKVDLKDNDTQYEIYKKIYDEFNDPFVLRLALTPQYHFRYQGVNFNGFFELLRSIYTRIYSPKPRGQQYGIVDRATYKQLVERLNNIKGDVNKMMHFMKLSAAYSIWLSKSKGIELIVDKSQFLIDDKFNLGVCFLEQRRMFDPFPIEDLKEMLSCGYFYNPWEYLHNILLGSSPKSIAYLGNFRKIKYQLQLDRLDAKSEKERVQSDSSVKEGSSSIQTVSV
jgi:hypothetical protein